MKKVLVYVSVFVHEDMCTRVISDLCDRYLTIKKVCLPEWTRQRR